jgi:hypothetical protein
MLADCQMMRHGKPTVFQEGGCVRMEKKFPAGERVEPNGQFTAANTVAATTLKS